MTGRSHQKQQHSQSLIVRGYLSKKQETCQGETTRYLRYHDYPCLKPCQLCSSVTPLPSVPGIHRRPQTGNTMCSRRAFEAQDSLLFSDPCFPRPPRKRSGTARGEVVPFPGMTLAVANLQPSKPRASLRESIGSNFLTNRSSRAQKSP